jgi:Transcriptional regulatory protein, C terminal
VTKPYSSPWIVALKNSKSLTLEQRLSAALERIGILEDKLRDLEFTSREVTNSTLSGNMWDCPVEWGLTPSESKILGFIIKKKGATASKEMLMNTLYSDKNLDGGDSKIVDVLVCKVRKKVPFQLLIAMLNNERLRGNLPPITFSGIETRREAGYCINSEICNFVIEKFMVNLESSKAFTVQVSRELSKLGITR